MSELAACQFTNVQQEFHHSSVWRQIIIILIRHSDVSNIHNLWKFHKY